MDIEAVVARFLKDEIVLPTYLDVPAETPEEFLTVEQTGGGGGFLEPAQLDVDCWADTRKRAKAIAELVQSCVIDLDDEPNLFSPSVTNVYKMPDPDTGKPRYVVQVEVWICE